MKYTEVCVFFLLKGALSIIAHEAFQRLQKARSFVILEKQIKHFLISTSDLPFCLRHD